MRITLAQLRAHLREAIGLTCKRCGGQGAINDPDYGYPLCNACALKLDNEDRAERAAEADAYEQTAPSKRLARFGHMGVRRYGSWDDR